MARAVDRLVSDQVAAPTAALFITSVNELIDLHAKRVNLGIRNRVPISIWAALYFVSIVTMTAVGYYAGLTATRRSPAILALVLTFSAVILLIADLDRPYEGLPTVNQQAILDLSGTRCGSRRAPVRSPAAPRLHKF